MKKKRELERQFSANDRETRRQILEAAQQLFLARGYKGVSMKDVAEAVEVTSAALYYHFPEGKQDIFLSVVQMILEEWTQGAMLATKHTRYLRERLERLTQYLFTLPIDSFSHLVRDMRENVLDPGKNRKFVHEIRDTFAQHVTDIFQQAIDENEITQGIPASILASMYEGMCISVLRTKHLVTSGIENFDAEQMTAFILSVLFTGIARTSETTS